MEKGHNIHLAKETKNPLLKILWIFLGCLFVGLGALGAVIPGMPTTIFLVVAAACFIRSSQKLYDWLIKNKTFEIEVAKRLTLGTGSVSIRTKNIPIFRHF